MGKKVVMRHLSAATAFDGGNGLGACFYRAAALVLDVPGTDLCIGTLAGATAWERALYPQPAQGDFIHAWAEIGGSVFAPSMLSARNKEMGPFPSALYYEANGVRDVSRLTRSQVLHLSGEIGLSAHLMHARSLKGGRTLGEALLEAAGIRYSVVNRAVVPALGDDESIRGIAGC
jgi:hypothetical protein